MSSTGGIAGLGTFNATTGWSGCLAGGDEAFWPSAFAESVWLAVGLGAGTVALGAAGGLICGLGFGVSTASGWPGGGVETFAAGGAGAVVSGAGADI
jgi:hypothetical protein